MGWGHEGEMGDLNGLMKALRQEIAIAGDQGKFKSSNHLSSSPNLPWATWRCSYVIGYIPIVY